MNNKSNKRQIISTNVAIVFLLYMIFEKSALNNEQIIYTAILLIISTNLLFLKYKTSKIISLIGFVCIGLFLSLGFLPLYNNAINEFELTNGQQIEYIFIGDVKNHKIIDETEFGEQIIIAKNDKQKLFLVENDYRKIRLEQIENKDQKNSKFVINFPNGSIYIVYPGTQIAIEKDAGNYKITKEYGNIEFYKANDNLQIITENIDLGEWKKESDFSLGDMIEKNEERKIAKIINQAGGIIVMQEMYQKISKNIIDIAFKIRPEKYGKNIENYKQYSDILGRKIQKKEYEEDSNWRESIVNQVKKGRKETNFLK